MIVVGHGAEIAHRKLNEKSSGDDAVGFGHKTASEMSLPRVALPMCMLKFNFKTPTSRATKMTQAEMEQVGNSLLHCFASWATGPEVTFQSVPEYPSEFGILIIWKEGVQAVVCIGLAQDIENKCLEQGFHY